MEESRFEIRSPELTLRLVEPTPDTYIARLIAAELQAEAAVFHFGGDYLDKFLADLATDWRGWKGEREWSSLEGTLALRASISAGGEVIIAVSITERHWTWAVSGNVHIENGRLDSIASDASTFCKLLGAAT
jgi:hypothetical protein